MKKVFQLFVLFMLVGCGQEESISLAVPQNVMDKNMQDGELFLQSNLSQNGVIEVEPGLQYLVINNGDEGARQPVHPIK